jgi:hypothetical protein
MGRLRAAVDDELAVGIAQRDARVLLERQMRVPLEEEHVVEHVIGGGDCLVHVAELQRDDLVDIAFVAVVVNARLRMREAVLRRRERAERLVLDVDEIEGALGGGFVGGNDRGHRIADEAHEIRAERVFVVADGQHAVRDRERGAGEHEVHARLGLGARRVDADDACVGMRRAEQLAVQHPREQQVVGESRLAGHFRAGVHPPPRRADDAPAGSHEGTSSAFATRAAAASTASMIWL